MNDTPQRPVSKTVGSVTFTDPYDWLQKDTPEALDWMWARDAEARVAAETWPGYAALKAAIASEGSASGGLVAPPPRLVGGLRFSVRPSTQSPVRALWVSRLPNEPGRVVIESAALAGPGDDAASVVMYWYEPSPDGRFVACAVTSRGEMTGTWRIVEVATGTVLDVELPCIAYTGALPGWLPDASGLYLADRIEDGRHRVRFVPLKSTAPVRPERVFEFSEIPANVSGVTIEVSPNGTKAIALAGPHERIALMLGDLAAGQWRRFLPAGFEGECQGVWLDESTYVARVHEEDTPRGRVVAIPVATSMDPASWREQVPPSRAMLKACTVVQGHVALAEVLDCSVRFRVVELAGQGERVLPLDHPGNSMVAMLMRRFDRSDALTFDYGGFARASTCFLYDVHGQSLKTLGPPGARIEGVKITQKFARSPDGARVPYFLVHRADLDLSVPQPTMLTGYGGFNVAYMPMPLGHLAPFVQAGGVLVHANLRGGGEYGKPWHEAGRLACKWNVFLDLFAVAEQLIADGVTRPDRLAMTGASNGGLLAGAAIVHRPDLWRVVVPVVPIFDQMEPLPREPQFDAVRAIFLEDYGNPDDPVMSKVLYSYSPYHNVKTGVSYPAVYQVFGEKDLGCMPFHGRKFTAALRQATASGHPVHLRVWKDTGHGSVDPEIQAAQAAEWLGFVMQQLGMSFPPVQ